jgi:hypothetical protein
MGLHKRQAKKAGPKYKHKMTSARATALEAVPGWAWALNLEAAWEEKLAALCAYVTARRRLPPQRDAAGLGMWVSNQREAKKAADAGRRSTMTPERVAALEAVPGWTWGPPRRAAAPAAALPAKRAKKAGL